MADASAEPFGVALSQYALVLAGQAEGLELEDALAMAGIEAAIWPDADAAYNRLLARAVVNDDPLVGELDRALEEARAHYARAVPPLDEDIESWFDFVRTWAESSDPLAMLDTLGLSQGDVLRLTATWTARLAEDEALRKRLSGAAARPPRPLPEVRPAPRAIDPLVASRPRGQPPAPASSPDPSADRVPPLFGSSFTEEQTTTELHVLISDQPVLPFQPDPAGDAPRAAQVADSSRDPLPFRAPSAEPTSLLALPSYACLCAELATYPSHSELVFARYGLSDPTVRAAVDGAWRTRLSQSVEEYDLWARAYAAHLEVLKQR